MSYEYRELPTAAMGEIQGSNDKRNTSTKGAESIALGEAQGIKEKPIKAPTVRNKLVYDCSSHLWCFMLQLKRATSYELKWSEGWQGKSKVRLRFSSLVGHLTTEPEF